MATKTPRQYWPPAALRAIAQMARKLRQIEHWIRRNSWGDPMTLYGFELAEDHPGRGILFTVYLGEWSPATHSWSYARTDENLRQCIDWRCCEPDLPYPDECATGLGEFRGSDAHDYILEVVALDCNSPGCHH